MKRTPCDFKPFFLLAPLKTSFLFCSLNWVMFGHLFSRVPQPGSTYWNSKKQSFTFAKIDYLHDTHICRSDLEFSSRRKCILSNRRLCHSCMRKLAAQTPCVLGPCWPQYPRSYLHLLLWTPRTRLFSWSWAIIPLWCPPRNRIWPLAPGLLADRLLLQLRLHAHCSSKH